MKFSMVIAHQVSPRLVKRVGIGARNIPNSVNVPFLTQRGGRGVVASVVRRMNEVTLRRA